MLSQFLALLHACPGQKPSLSMPWLRCYPSCRDMYKYHLFQEAFPDVPSFPLPGHSDTSLSRENIQCYPPMVASISTLVTTPVLWRTSLLRKGTVGKKVPHFTRLEGCELGAAGAVSATVAVSLQDGSNNSCLLVRTPFTVPSSTICMTNKIVSKS